MAAVVPLYIRDCWTGGWWLWKGCCQNSTNSRTEKLVPCLWLMSIRMWLAITQRYAIHPCAIYFILCVFFVILFLLFSFLFIYILYFVFYLLLVYLLIANFLLLGRRWPIYLFGVIILCTDFNGVGGWTQKGNRQESQPMETRTLVGEWRRRTAFVIFKSPSYIGCRKEAVVVAADCGTEIFAFHGDCASRPQTTQRPSRPNLQVSIPYHTQLNTSTTTDDTTPPHTIPHHTVLHHHSMTT